MTIQQLIDKVDVLEKRVSLLESQKQIINVYPYYQPVTQQYQPAPKFGTPWNPNWPTTGGAVLC